MKGKDPVGFLYASATLWREIHFCLHFAASMNSWLEFRIKRKQTRCECTAPNDHGSYSQIHRLKMSRWKNAITSLIMNELIEINCHAIGGWILQINSDLIKIYIKTNTDICLCLNHKMKSLNNGKWSAELYGESFAVSILRLCHQPIYNFFLERYWISRGEIFFHWMFPGFSPVTTKWSCQRSSHNDKGILLPPTKSTKRTVKQCLFRPVTSTAFKHDLI